MPEFLAQIIFLLVSHSHLFFKLLELLLVVGDFPCVLLVRTSKNEFAITNPADCAHIQHSLELTSTHIFYVNCDVLIRKRPQLMCAFLASFMSTKLTTKTIQFNSHSLTSSVCARASAPFRIRCTTNPSCVESGLGSRAGI